MTGDSAERTTGAATAPPPGLPGLDPAWSRLLRARSADGTLRTWHLLDTGPLLEASGVVPVGTVLAVHGNPTWSYLWRDVVAASLDAPPERSWRVVAVDQLGMGWSERPAGARRLATRVTDLGLLTDALGLAGPVVTLGHDWGGVVSLGWAIDHPELLAAVVLLNTGVRMGPEPLPAALRLALAPGVRRAGTAGTTAFLDTTLALAHPRLGADVRAAYRAPYRSVARRAAIEAFVADIPAAPGHPSRAEFARIGSGTAALTVPALLLWGPADPVFGERYLADLMARLPHADVHRFEGAGHLVAEDADIAGTVLTWLDDVLGEGSPPLGSAAPNAGAAAAAPFEPLWSVLESRADDDGLALAELAPLGGRGPRTVGWRLLSRRVAELATGLHRIGVRRGQRVSLLVPPGADLTAALYACLRIGAVVVVADAGLGLRGLTRAVRGARPDWVIGVPAALAVATALRWPGTRISTATLPAAARRLLGVRHSFGELVRRGADVDLPDPPGPEDPAAVLFTSGSTGPAKGVRYTHRRLAGVRDALRGLFDVREDAGLVAGFGPFALLGPAFGCRTAIPDMNVTKPASLTASALAAAAASVGAESVFLSPAALRNVVATADGLDPSGRAALTRVRVLLSAGAPVGEPLLARATAVFPSASLHTPYGMTEGLLITDVTLDGIRAAGAGGPGGGVCVGLPAAGSRIRIAPLDASGRAAATGSGIQGTTGEILVSAPHILDGYDRLWRTDRAARAGTADDRWHRTGDVGHLDGGGRLWVEGRLPHVIVTADGVVTPVGVEQAAERVPAVRRAAAVGVGPRGVQQLVLVVETDPAVARPAVADLGLADAVRAEVPRPVAAVLVVPVLPTDIRHNSKIDRASLGAWASDVLAGGRMRRP